MPWQGWETMWVDWGYSLLEVSVDQGLVGEHEATVGTQQQAVAHAGHGG